jgi:hypothetical protein
MFTYIIRLRAGSANVAKLPEFFDFMHHDATRDCLAAVAVLVVRGCIFTSRALTGFRVTV